MACRSGRELLAKVDALEDEEVLSIPRLKGSGTLKVI